MERDQAAKFMNDLLRLMVQRRGSDLFITDGFPPAIKIDGKVTPVSSHALTSLHIAELVRAIMNERQAADFDAHNECNFAIAPPQVGRFRANAFIQRGRVGLICRAITSKIPTLEELGVPAMLKDLAMLKRGLVILVGGTGVGKTSTLAAMIDHRNQNAHEHIITLEDPIEYVHEHKNCLITQREIGLDTDSWETGIHNALRQAPDVILMGEIRNREAMESAITISETGHLALATLHANSSYQALERIVNFFPEERRTQLLMDLSLNLRATIAQRLVPRKGGRGRVPAVEIMINTSTISHLILKGEIQELRSVIKKSRELGMQTFDQSLFDLCEANTISQEDALAAADSTNDLRLQLKLESKESRNRDLTKDIPSNIKIDSSDGTADGYTLGIR